MLPLWASPVGSFGAEDLLRGQRLVDRLSLRIHIASPAFCRRELIHAVAPAASY